MRRAAMREAQDLAEMQGNGREHKAPDGVQMPPYIGVHSAPPQSGEFRSVLRPDRGAKYPSNISEARQPRPLFQFLISKCSLTRSEESREGQEGGRRCNARW